MGISAGGIAAVLVALGGQPADVYLGAVQAWPIGTPPPPPALSCATVGADKATVASGAWTTPGIWSPPGVPAYGDTVCLEHLVTSSTRVRVVGTGSQATYGSAAIEALYERPGGVLRFTNATSHTSGGTFPCGTALPEANNGLWVVCDGKLDIQGTPKTSWTRLAGSAFTGNTFLDLEVVPVGWKVGDRVVIAPTEHPSVGDRNWTGFEERTLTAVSGATVTLDAALSHPHPSTTDPFTGEVHTAEVMNLTRDVGGEGTSSARSHVLIQATVPQTIKHADLRWLGPNVTGRYPLHFHHSGDGSRGSLVEGVVVRQSGNRAFVPHASHGVTFRDTIAYDAFSEVYWWDPGAGNETHDTLYDRTIAAKILPYGAGWRHAAYFLGDGNGNAIIDSVAVGVQGFDNASGYTWPEDASSTWTFTGNVAHNNKIDGIFTWQNNSNVHVIEDFVAYHNGWAGLDHGAYLNRYQYINNRMWGHGVGEEPGTLRLHAQTAPEITDRPDGYSLAFEDFKGTDALFVIPGSEKVDDSPVLFLRCAFSEIVYREDSFHQPTNLDFVECIDADDGLDLQPADFIRSTTWMRPTSVIRVQRADGTAYRIVGPTGSPTAIPAFYPDP